MSCFRVKDGWMPPIRFDKELVEMSNGVSAGVAVRHVHELAKEVNVAEHGELARQMNRFCNLRQDNVSIRDASASKPRRGR